MKNINIHRLWLLTAVLASAGLDAVAQSTNVVLGPITNNAVYSAQSVEEYLVQASSAGDGTVTGDTNNWIESGSNATINATPAAYYEFTQWSDGNTDSNRSLTVVSPTSLVASFAKQIDADGVAEDWKAENTITNVLEDTDKDGVLDRDEYFADTNPRGSNDFFKTELVWNAGVASVGFPVTSTNCHYDVMGISNFLDGSWQSWTDFVGTGSAFHTDPSQPNFPTFVGGKVNRINP